MEKTLQNIHWYCNICEGAAKLLVLAISELSRRQDELEQAVNKQEERIDAAEEMLGEQEKRVSEVSDKVVEHENTVRAQTDIIAQAQASTHMTRVQSPVIPVLNVNRFSCLRWLKV